MSIGFLGKFDPERPEYQKRARPPSSTSKAREYDRFKGLDRVQVYPQLSYDRVPYNWVTARSIASTLAKKRRYRPTQILIRIYWSPKKTRPHRKKNRQKK